MGFGRATQHRAHSTEGGIIVEFRRRALLPLHEVMGCFKDSIPNLTRRGHSPARD